MNEGVLLAFITGYSLSLLITVVGSNAGNYLPPLNWSTMQQQTSENLRPVPAPATAPPPPLPRHSARGQQQHTDGETSGYHSDNHLIDPSHIHRHIHSSTRNRPVTDLQQLQPADESGHKISARADYKFLERRKWVQDGTVPYDLYPECLPQIYDTRTPPRWVQAPPSRPHNATVQTEPILTGTYDFT